MIQTNEISDLELCTKELINAGAFKKHTNSVVNELVSVLEANTPRHMAEAISVFSLGSFINSFNCKIRLTCEDTFPMSLVFIVLAGSGSNKTSSVGVTKQAFAEGYKHINTYREMIARDRLERATGNFDAPIEVSEIEVELGTVPGFIASLNSFQEENLGSPSILIDEVATKFANKDDEFEKNLGVMAQLFDNGNLPSKMMKSIEAKTKPVTGMAITVMMIGAEHALINNRELLTKFDSEMISKFSRRGFFAFPEVVNHTNTSLDSKDFLRKEYAKEDHKIDTLHRFNQLSVNIASRFLNSKNDKHEIDIDDEAKNLYFYYRGYCNEKALTIEDEKVGLEQKHRHWKTLKLAGIFSVANENPVITMQDLLEAISFAESLAGYMKRFSEKANELNYEKLVNICIFKHTVPSPHELMKLGLISNEKEISGLIQLANSKMNDLKLGYIIRNEDTHVLEFKEYEESDTVGLSYIMVNGNKKERATRTKSGYVFKHGKFEDVAKVMSNDTAYCAFNFKDGIRGKDNVIGKTNLLVLDVDDSDLKDSEVSNLLEDYRHIVCRTSDGNNPYKFRVAIQTDVMFDISHHQWKDFLLIVAEDLGLVLDSLAKSQIYYGYKNRTPVINSDGQCYPVSEILSNLESNSKEVFYGKISDSDKEVWRNRHQYFKMWYDVPSKLIGKTVSLYACAEYGMRRGLSADITFKVVRDIDDFRDTHARYGYIDKLEETLRRKHEQHNE